MLLQRFRGGVPADVFGQQQLYDAKRCRRTREGIYIFDIPLLGIYRPKAFTIRQFFLFLDIIEGEASRQRPFPSSARYQPRGIPARPLRGMGDWRGAYPSALGADDTGLVNALVSSGHVRDEEDLKKMMSEQVGSSEYARKSQEQLKVFLAAADEERKRIDKLVEGDESRRSHI